MKIEYLGHSCFKLTNGKGTSIVCDPYESSIGYSMPKISADAVTVSHGHFDHNYVKGVGGKPVVFDKAGEYVIGDVKVTTVDSFHDEQRGVKRGKNLIFKFDADGLIVCHLGDLGEPCSADLVGKLSHIDVLLIPVGGFYTIDAKLAKQYVDAIKPAIVIPMHYKTAGCNINIESVDRFLNSFDKSSIEIFNSNIVEITRNSVNDNVRVFVLRY